MEPADSWEKLSDALLGPFEREIIDGLTGAYRAMEPRIEQAFKRSLDGGSAMPLQRLLILRQQLGQELSAMRLPPELAQTVNQALLDGQVSSDFWALAELNKVKQEARSLTPEQAAQAFANASTDPSLLLGPGMAQQNPTALIAAAQRQNALANYAAGGRGTQAFAALNRLVDVDLRGRIIGAVEFHLASGDSWRQLRSTLQSSVELTKARAQTVARTEMAAAMVEGTKLRYEAEGIEQVQWQAVGSSRTCGYCAPRHGKVYKLGDVVAPAHPNCRCTVTPWDPEWAELGLVDPQAEAKARADVLADLEAAGKKPISGPSPFEKALGQDTAPEPLWTPGDAIKQAKAKPPKPKATPAPTPPPTPTAASATAPAPAPAPTPKPKADVKPPKGAIKQWSSDDGYKHMRAEQLRQAEANGVKLTAFERGQVEQYPTSAGQKKNLQALTEYVDNAKKYEGKVYRGMNMSTEDFNTVLKSLEAGNPTNSLESWTKSSDIKTFTIGGKNQVIMSVDNKRGVDISAYSPWGDTEQEVLQPSGVRYTVKNVVREEIDEGFTAKGIYRYRVDLEQLDD